MHELDEAIKEKVNAYKDGLKSGQVVALKGLLQVIADSDNLNQVSGYIHERLEYLEKRGE